MMKFTCIIDKFTDIKCDKIFTKEIQLHTHMLFEHNILMPICSTGIDEKLFKDNMELIKQYRNNKFELSRARNLLKRRLLKSMYGKKSDMTDTVQSNYFITSINNHDNHLHSRIQFIEHTRYDHHRDLNKQLEEKLKIKGIVNT